jgi:predicted CXXCH cytochrome family protein
MFVGILIFCSLWMQGCDPAKKHQVLSFFFDGVPPLEGEPSAGDGETDGSGADVPAVTEPEAGDAGEIAVPEPVRIQTVKHPPYEMKMCDNCHDMQGADTGTPRGFSLVEERNKLCWMCHDDMSPESLTEQYRWIHGPVQLGACLECHDPHESPNPYMLRRKEVRQLCFRCHDDDRLLQTEMHAEIDEAECTECHDPHGSDDRYLLR